MPTLIPLVSTDKIHPAGERRVITRLMEQLPDDVLIYHNFETLTSEVRESSQQKYNSNAVRGRQLREGEIDVVIVWPNKGVLVIEIKGGDIFRPGSSDDWFSKSSRGETFQIKNPFEQARKNNHRLKVQFALALKVNVDQLPFVCGYAVIFPDFRWDGTLPMNADASILCDGTQLPSISRFIESALAKWKNDHLHALGQHMDVKTIRRALSGEFDLVRLLSLQIEEDKANFVRLTDHQKGFLDFAGNIDKACIQGVAGSGKTLLAVEQCCRYAASGLSTLLLCFNKGLSSWLQQVISEDLQKHITIHHFHEWCATACEEHDIPFEPAAASNPNDFWRDTAAELLMQCADVQSQPYDAIVVDEGQDFLPDWWIAIQSHLKPSGKFFVFYDQAQDIFKANGMDALIDMPSFNLPVNCRNTRAIADYCADVLDCDIATREDAPAGEPVKHLKSSKKAHGIEQLIDDWVNKDNIKPSQIVIQSPYRKEKTLLADEDQIAGVALTSCMDDWYEDKGILVTTVRAFKGLEADIVVLLDAPEVDSHRVFNRADKYVACSRARSLLVVV
jgi:hypothetical protein